MIDSMTQKSVTYSFNLSEDKNYLAAAMRSRRDRLLQESDKYMLPDYPLSDEQRRAVEEYRAALRTLPEKEDFPFVTTFPVLSLEEE